MSQYLPLKRNFVPKFRMEPPTSERGREDKDIYFQMSNFTVQNFHWYVNKKHLTIDADFVTKMTRFKISYELPKNRHMKCFMNFVKLDR